MIGWQRRLVRRFRDALRNIEPSEMIAKALDVVHSIEQVLGTVIANSKLSADISEPIKATEQRSRNFIIDKMYGKLTVPTTPASVNPSCGPWSEARGLHRSFAVFLDVYRDGYWSPEYAARSRFVLPDYPVQHPHSVATAVLSFGRIRKTQQITVGWNVEALQWLQSQAGNPSVSADEPTDAVHKDIKEVLPVLQLNLLPHHTEAVEVLSVHANNNDIVAFQQSTDTEILAAW